MGGEVTGTIDESIRHAVTKLAHIHFPANEDAARRIIQIGEDPENVYVVGCPRIDIVKEVLKDDQVPLDELYVKYKGVGPEFDLHQPFLISVFHPVTTEYSHNRRYVEELIGALDTLKMPTIMLWPNADAGSELIAKGIRTFRERHRPEYLHLFKNLPFEIFVNLMDRCRCMVGNSSAAIREGAFIGVPAVNIGTRQNGRMRGHNVLDVGYDGKEILKAIERQISHTKYPMDPIYGDGTSGEKIADILARCQVKVQKRIKY
jgi:UDP-hydrolysing UDP-N-acetyl-D-glucosamine 2-epimerase